MATSKHQVFDRGTLVESRDVEVPPEQTNADTLRSQGEQTLDGLRQIKSSSGTLSTAVLSAQVRTLANAVLILVRLRLGRLEATD